MAKPSIISKSNITQFFDYIPINNNQIKPGMLIKFAYYSPQGVHDNAPLVYVVEVEKDRIWGLNLDYKFSLVAEIVKSKQIQVDIFQKHVIPITSPKVEPKKQEEKPSVLKKLPKLNKILPKKTTEGEKPISSKPLPLQLLETFTLKSPKQEGLLRNYLPERMRGKFKLIYKA